MANITPARVTLIEPAAVSGRECAFLPNQTNGIASVITAATKIATKIKIASMSICVICITPAVTGAFVVSAASEKCVRVDGLVSVLVHGCLCSI